MKGEWETDMHELCKPVKSVEEKWKLLPHFFKLRGLLRQHIDSFNYFINTGMKDIVRAQTNYLHRSDVNPAWFFEYTRVNVGMPSVQEDSHLIEKSKRPTL
jgi:DNA-directed RNA polymerase III subunit RPC2